MPLDDYENFRLEQIRNDAEFAKEYLMQSLQEDTPQEFLKALENVINALYGDTRSVNQQTMIGFLQGLGLQVTYTDRV